MNFIRVAIGLGIFVAVALDQPKAETVAFDPPAYAVDRALRGQDGWAADPESSGDSAQYSIQSDGAAGGLFHGRVGNDYTVSRPFRPVGPVVEVKWKWRFEDNTATRFCVGVGPEAVTDEIPMKLCAYPGGLMHFTGPSGNMLTTPASYPVGIWHAMRLRVDQGKGKWYLTATAEGKEEKMVIDTTALPSSLAALTGGAKSAGLGRLFLRSEGGDGIHGVDLDDITWLRGDAKMWAPSAQDSTWTNAKNWQPNGVPDSTHAVVFPAGSTRGSVLGKAFKVESVQLQKGYAGRLDFSDYALEVSGSADFSGGSLAYGRGLIRLGGSGLQEFTVSPSSRLPPIIHDGKGTIRLLGGALLGSNFSQSSGSLDLNGMDMLLTGSLLIQEGGPTSIRNLGGRTLAVSGNADLFGRADSLLALAPATAWHFAVSGTLTAESVALAHGRADSAMGYARNSQDLGNNVNWTFQNPPVVMALADSVWAYPGEAAELGVSVGGAGVVTYQWLRDGMPVANALDSVLRLSQVTLAQDGGLYQCRVTNGLGSTLSHPIALRVVFPAPAPDTQEREISGSLEVGFISPVPHAEIFASRNDEPFSALTGKWTLTAPTQIRVFARLGQDHSDTVSYAFSAAETPRTPMPTATPAGRNFGDSLSVALGVQDSAAVVHYTDDDTPPSSTSPVYAAPLMLKRTTVLQAMALGKGLRNSLAIQELYLDTAEAAVLTDAPMAKPDSGALSAATAIALSAPEGRIWWRFPGMAWRPYDLSAPVWNGESHLEAVAVQGHQRSAISLHPYRSGLVAPMADPVSQKFRDTLSVTLVNKGEGILYAAKNRDIDTSTDRYTHPFLLDSTAVIRAYTQNGKQVSALSEWIYKLDPEMPRAAPGSDSLLEPGLVTLSSPTRKATLYFTLDGSDPDPETATLYTDPIPVEKNLTLKAIAVTGALANRLISPILSEKYAIRQGEETLTLSSDFSDTLVSEWVFSLHTESPHAVQIKTQAPPEDLSGFDKVRNAFEVTGWKDGDQLWISRLDSMAGKWTIWHLPPANSKPSPIMGAASLALPGNGRYFTGVDTLPPRLSYAGTTLDDEGFSQVTFTVSDNAAAMDYQVWRSDQPETAVKATQVNSGEILRFKLKNPPGPLKTLGIRLCAQEITGSSETCLPRKAGAWLPIKQRTESFTVPSAWRVGSEAEDKWDFVGFPLLPDTGLTVKALAEANGIGDLTFARWDPDAKDDFQFLSDKAVLAVGQAYWAASKSPLENPAFPGGVYAASGEKTFTYTLKPGWNAIASKSLDPMAWPVSRSQSSAYRKSRLKGLWQFHSDPDAGWETTDSFQPWRGYFVYWNGAVDTTLDLDNPATPLAKGAQEDPDQAWSIRLEQGRRVVDLGATATALDDFDSEDEMALPTRRDAPLRALRQGRSLMSDFVSRRPETLLAWKVIRQGDDRFPLRAVRAGFPEGYAVAAYSERRAMSFDLFDAAGLPALPVGYTDTLTVIAGPKALVSARLESWPARDIREGWHWSSRGEVILQLQANREVTLDRIDPAGRILGRSRYRLPMGRFSLPPPGMASGKPTAAGRTWLRVVLEGERPVYRLTLPMPGF